MKTKTISKLYKQKALGIIEMIGSVVIISLIMVGMAQFLIVNRLLTCDANIRQAIQKELNARLIEHQEDNNGTNTVTPSANVASYITSDGITLIKTDTNITATTSWKSVWEDNSQPILFSNTISLDIVGTP